MRKRHLSREEAGIRKLALAGARSDPRRRGRAYAPANPIGCEGGTMSAGALELSTSDAGARGRRTNKRTSDRVAFAEIAGAMGARIAGAVRRRTMTPTNENARLIRRLFWAMCQMTSSHVRCSLFAMGRSITNIRSIVTKQIGKYVAMSGAV